MSDKTAFYKPEYTLLEDAYMGKSEEFAKKLAYLADLAQNEPWEYPGTRKRPFHILYNYLHYTYDRVKQEGKIVVTSDEKYMCFNTGLQTNRWEDIYAYFEERRGYPEDGKSKWYFVAFLTNINPRMEKFSGILPAVADYFTEPADFIFNKNFPIVLDYDHIIADNKERFLELGLTDNENIIQALLKNAVDNVTMRLQRNYKIAIPQFYLPKGANQPKIQLLLPLCLRTQNTADLALVLDKSERRYIGKTVLTLEWAYTNSRRIVKPDVDWLNIKEN